MSPEYINPLQWNEAMGIARQFCARVFRDGGSPVDALKAYGVKRQSYQAADMSWDKVVACVAEALCSRPMRRAA